MAGNANRRRKPLSFWTEIDVKAPKRTRSRKRSEAEIEAAATDADQTVVETSSSLDATPNEKAINVEANRMPIEASPAAPEIVSADADAGETDQAASDGALSLPAALDLAAASELTRALLARRGQTVVIDAAAVLHLSAPCAQVLMSAAATWLADDAPFAVENCGAKMMDDLRFLGVAPSLLNIEAAAQ